MSLQILHYEIIYNVCTYMITLYIWLPGRNEFLGLRLFIAMINAFNLLQNLIDPSASFKS